MYDAILIPTDGSEHAELAGRHGRALAERFGATVHVLGVADVQGAAGPFNVGGVSDEFVDRVEAACDEAIERVAGDAAADLECRTAVVEGDPATEILAYADAEGVDAIAMGTRGQRGLRRFLTGSVTTHVVREARVPVLTARVTDADPVTDYDRVMIPTDGSSAAAAAVDHGVAVADAFDATVHAFSVVDLGAIAAGADAGPPTHLLERFQDRAEDATDAIADAAREAGVDVVTEVREGFPGPGLLEYADEADIDLIAMGTHGRTGVDRLLLGSTTERTIRRAEAPVLSVHPEASAPEE